MEFICKRLAAVMVLAAVLGISGCGDNAPEPKKNPVSRLDSSITILPGFVTFSPFQNSVLRGIFSMFSDNIARRRPFANDGLTGRVLASR